MDSKTPALRVQKAFFLDSLPLFSFLAKILAALNKSTYNPDIESFKISDITRQIKIFTLKISMFERIFVDFFY